MFSTERLWLYALEEGDYYHLMCLHNDVQIQRMRPIDAGHWLAPRSCAFGKQWVQELITNKDTMVFIFRLRPDDVVGILDVNVLSAKNRNATFGIMISPKHWSKGYGTEVLTWLINYVFVELGLHWLALDVFASNTRAIRLYQRLGFMEEGREREAYWNSGKWEDVVKMSMLESDWKKEAKPGA
ncbi:acyl-CoA N-acyltransferase [Cylindrobasidium torrendii FP15055 ss-10]|uniref:Acyl-CoA N-acyltransferase n=1 Tax=Cylindrobasidium torrendii FP15055 ss-10 TaxID=1314674 RepID=A0A0D7B6A6_9AGAR|nr:acyl-CoA N-acyltransferase [Cylindrobasidium torrendii FP15055 ss-10]